MCFGFNLVMVILVLALRSCEVGSVASLIKQTEKAQKGKASYSVDLSMRPHIRMWVSKSQNPKKAKG